MSDDRGNDAPLRRSTHVDHGAFYAAVGASAAPDLMRFPPDGATPYEFELQLGSGSERFLIASSALMTWGAQRGAGVRVRDIEHGDGGEYTGVEFDEHGTPLPQAEPEIEYGPDGEPFVAAGTLLSLHWADGRMPRRMRVVYTISEPRKIGYAWGSADGDGAVGEERFLVEHREDDTVWASVRGVWWPASGPKLDRKSRIPIKQLLKESQAQLAALVTGVLPTGG